MGRRSRQDYSPPHYRQLLQPALRQPFQPSLEEALQHHLPPRFAVQPGVVQGAAETCSSSRDFFRGLIFKNHVYSAEQTDLVLVCSKTYRLDEKFVDTAENQPLKVRPTRSSSRRGCTTGGALSVHCAVRASVLHIFGGKGCVEISKSGKQKK